MSEHRALVHWSNDSGAMDYESYSRDHEWSFKEGAQRWPASAAPAFHGNPSVVDPEDAFVAALASCHMLTFLALAARRRLVVASYSDNAVGHLEKDASGRLAMTRVDLHPEVRFAAGSVVSDAELARLHQKAHEQCFIGNSVKSTITWPRAVAA
jgi:organic hydroperoxide reductase OsmC/OhrA